MRKSIYGVFLLISITICLITLGAVLSKSTIKETVKTTKEEQSLGGKIKLYEVSKNVRNKRSWDNDPYHGYLPTKHNKFNAPEHWGIETANKAVQISSIIFKSIHHEKYKKYKVTLVNDRIWFVRGYNTIIHSTLMIQKSDGRVLHISKNPNIVRNKHYTEDIKTLFSQINSFKNDKNYIAKYGYTPDSTVYTLPDGIIKDAQTAAEIGLKVLYSNYGDNIYKQLPLILELHDGTVWNINTYYTEHTIGWKGIYIQKSDGRILCCYHYK